MNSSLNANLETKLNTSTTAKQQPHFKSLAMMIPRVNHTPNNHALFAMSTVIFYYDVVCPFAYTASKRIDAVVQRLGGTVHWRPVLLGMLGIVYGNS